jgi:hypothetical protein
LSLNWCAKENCALLIILDYDVTVTLAHKQDTELYRNCGDKTFIRTCNKNGYGRIRVFRRMTWVRGTTISIQISCRHFHFDERRFVEWGRNKKFNDFQVRLFQSKLSFVYWINWFFIRRRYIIHFKWRRKQYYLGEGATLHLPVIAYHDRHRFSLQ